VPPLAVKEPGKNVRLGFLWTLAFRELRRAARCVVIGVSLAAGDVELRWLLRQAAEFRGSPVDLDLVDPSPDSRARAKALFAPTGSLREFASLDDFLGGRPL
jgi:hypothetical protein